MDKNYFRFRKSKSVLLVIGLFLLINSVSFSQTTTVTALSGTSPYCSGATLNVTYTKTGTYIAGNIFTAQLSDATGSFATSPVAIGTVSATGAGTINNCKLPYVATSSSLYRIRVISSTPTSTTTTDNGYGFTINPLTINAPTTTLGDSCQSEIFTLAYTVPCTFPAGNVFTAQLSNASGSFASPVAIGSVTATGGGNITCTIPAGTPAGTGYLIEVVSSSTVTNANGITSPTTTNNLSIYASSAPAGGVGTPGNGFWNAYCYDGLNNFSTNYMGYYTENNMNISTTLRLGGNNNLSPCLTNSLSGSAYAGCPFGSVLYSVRYLRTGIPCGYYEIDLPSHDDYVYVLINGVQTYSATCCSAVTNIWEGFIAPTTTVEIRYSNNYGPGNLAANFVTPAGGLTMPTPVTICAGTSASITAANSYTTGFTYSWIPASTVSPSTGSLSVTITPTATTIYTLSATDNNTLTATGCALTNTITITTNPIAATTLTVTLPSYSAADSYTPTAICSGVNTATLTASGAYTYSWSPSTGLSSTTGYSVVANPTITTTYTVSGSNNCDTIKAVATVTVQTPPTTPTYTTYGNNIWNAYCNYNTTFNDYYGYYTENNLSYNTTTRWVNSSGPSTCTNTSTGLAYSGCSMGETEWSISFKRTNTPCGYYSLDINYQDDQLRFLVNGVSVFYNGAYTTTTQTGVWQGFIGPTTTLEFQLVNGGGPGQMQVTFNPITYPILSVPVTICATSSTTLTATPYIAGANYVWTPNDGTLSTTTGTTTVASPTANETYTCVVTDPVTTCSASATDMITVNPLPTTSVTPTVATTSCSINGTYTLTASGANTYSWSPATGLNTTTGYSVIATPTVTTTYTVAGNNNCAAVNATSTITVIPLVSPTVFPTSNWNVYCYGDQTETNYYGYYTAPGTGTTGYNFSSLTQWSSGTAIPSNTNGTGPTTTYYGCIMPATNWSLSYKRSGFACGTYSINIVDHDDYFYLYVNGTQVAQHTNGCCDAHTAVWVGDLNSNSTVEVKNVQAAGGAEIVVTFSVAATSTATYTWSGGTSTDWFTASNWCGGGGGIPTSTTNVIIPAAGPENMPVINNTGAQCLNLTISPAITAGTYNDAIPSASLTINGTYTLDVYGNWNNGGSFIANNSTVNMDGTTATTMSCSSTQTFYNLNINNSVGVTMSSGTTQISNNLNFTNGIITQNATLQVLNGATTSGASNTGYVIGPIVKYGNQAFTFPVGGDNLYRPIAIAAPSLTTDNFTAQYFYANAYTTYSTTTWDLGIDHLSECEYWILNRTGGTSNVNVTLSWNTNSCGVTNLDSLLIARWDAGSNAWKNQGNGGYTGNTTTGTIITSAPVTNFSPFVLASHTTNTNPLPITLLYFSAAPVNNTVDLNWATETEVNNNYFTIDKSKDGINFKFLKQVSSEAINGNSNITLNYKTYDLEPYEGINYYRLTQTDRNGNNHYANITQVNFSNKSFVSVFPNPASNIVYVNVSTDYDNASLKLIDGLGREVLFQNINSSNVNSINTSSLMPGMYLMIIDNGNGLNKTKITIQK